MTNQQGSQDHILETVQELAHATNGQCPLNPALSAFARETSLLPLSQLAYWERTFRHELYLESSFTRHSRHLLSSWLDFCSADGYQRERALRTLDETVPNAFLFAMILRRLNDWVPQVRDAAREHIPRIAAQTEPDHILEALWAILPHIYTWGRRQNEDLDVLINLLAIDNIPLKLTSKLIEATAGPAASILGQAGRTSVLDKYLPTISDQAVQPAVRAKAYRSQLEERIVWFEGRKWEWTDIRWCRGQYKAVVGERPIEVDQAFIKTLGKAADDNSPMVRRVSGDALLKKLDHLGSEALFIAKKLSMDAYPSIAERGQFALGHLKA